MSAHPYIPIWSDAQDDRQILPLYKGHFKILDFKLSPCYNCNLLDVTWTPETYPKDNK